LYDPGTGTFSPTGSMTIAREFHTATLLSDGRVLVAGGFDFSGAAPGVPLASAELYDPKTGTFSSTGSMAIPGEGDTATLLPDGRVLFAGGDDLSGNSLASAELYDPKSGTFSPTGPMTTTREAQTAALLPDGRVLIAGGDYNRATASPGSIPLASAELYDPETGTFTPTGSMTLALKGRTATLLPDGRVLMAGGDQWSQVGPDKYTDDTSAAAELYNAKSGIFSSTGSMTTARFGYTATLLSDGLVLIAGGDSPRGVPIDGGFDVGATASPGPIFLASAELYDPKIGTFSPAGSRRVRG
jgi:hypothetical protein